MYSQNPFEEIDKRLSNIENLLLDLKHHQKPPEPSDRCQLKDACEILGLSKAAIYKLTHQRKISHAKFGSRLVFSRKQLAAWLEDHTVIPSDPTEKINTTLAVSARKRLRNAK